MHDDDSKIQRYRILAQYPDARLQVEDVVTKNQYIFTAHEIASDKDLIEKFGGKDGCLIGYIVASYHEAKVASYFARDKRTKH